MDLLKLLHDTLDDLTSTELKTFQLYLTEGGVEAFERIPKGKLEKCDCSDTARIMREVHGNDGALTVTLLILKKMERAKNNLANLAKKLEGELKKREEEKRRKLLQIQITRLNSGQPLTDACDLTLDPNTANRHVLLSDGNRKATWVEQEQPYLDNPDRFSEYPQVLSIEMLPERCYWECEWAGNGATVGVAYKSMNRSTWIGSDDKSWYLKCFSDRSTGYRYTFAHNRSFALIPTKDLGHKRVGVYLDREAGTVSFYSVSADTRTHLHTLYSTFTDEPCRIWQK